ncbi:MAG: hypothetical protein K2W95_35905 [Candidatus Obscuribacterales bacterium]|nr:hypothetical protein [Candidatus Obscuribacterales bacterium]
MRGYYDNKIAEVRSGSTFEEFQVYDSAQQRVVDLLKRVADHLLGRAPDVLNNEFPFDNGKVLFLWSKPGFGKTHLLEAFINRVKAGNAKLLQRMVLSRGLFEFDYQTCDSPYGVPVVVIDDMFHDKQSVSDLHPVGELASFMKFVTDTYERRALAIVTSNFPLLKGGIVERIAQVDKGGRIVSRMKELLACSGEIKLTGKDFRAELAKRRKNDEFTL